MLELQVMFTGWSLVFFVLPEVGYLFLSSKWFESLRDTFRSRSVLLSGSETMVSLINLGDPLDGSEPKLLDQGRESLVGRLSIGLLELLLTCKIFDQGRFESSRSPLLLKLISIPKNDQRAIVPRAGRAHISY